MFRLAVLVFLGPILSLAAPASAQYDAPLILVTNDDGYKSEHLEALVRRLDDDFAVLVAAPFDNQSGTSMMVSGFRGPIEWSQFEFDYNTPYGFPATGYWIDSSPSLAVHWGIDFAYRAYGKAPDLVISGINAGDNLGQSHHYSGTVGAARTARLLGVNAMAVSLARPEDPDAEVEHLARAAD